MINKMRRVGFLLCALALMASFNLLQAQNGVITISSDSIVPDSTKGELGFIANITQISTEQTGIYTLPPQSMHGNRVVNAEKQLNGEYIDKDSEEPYLNEADLEADVAWSYFPIIVEYVNQGQNAFEGGAEHGNFTSANGYPDEEIPGIPGWSDSINGIVGEYLALLQLDVGTYTLGVNSDDGFRATIGANYNDILTQEIGVFEGVRAAADSIFDIFVEKAGLYPFRVLWFENEGDASIEIFSMVDGEKVLINDPDVEGSIKAYTPKGATVGESITERDASTGRAAVVSIMPAPGKIRVESSSPIEVVIENGSATAVDQSSVKMSLNGKDVAADVSKSGNIVTISYTGGLAAEANTAILSFKESNGVERTAEWSFEVYEAGAAPAGIVWTGANGTDIFDEENWDLSNSNVTLIDPNVSIEDDVVFSNAIVDIPQLDAQQRFQVASGFTITVDNSTISLSGGSNDGIGGPPGSTLPAGPAGPILNVVNGSSLETFFIFQGITMNVDSTSSATLGGGGNPVNISVIDLEPEATLTFTRETIDQFNTEHLSKLTIGGAAAEEGVNFTIESDGNSGSIIKTITAAPAGIVWTGANGTDIFDEENWDLSNSNVTVIDPNVSIEDDVVFSNAIVDIPQVSSQQRFQVASDFTITVDNSTISLSGGSNEGIGGPPGATLPAGPAGPTLNVVNGSSLEAFFIVNGTTLNVDSTSSATLGGGGNPVNGSVIDLEPGATLTFTSETIDQFNTEHLSKLTIGGAVAEEGVNFTIESDGNSGSIVKAITAAPAVIVWTGANGTDIFDEENWDLSNSNVTVIDPNVSIEDDVVFSNAIVDIPQVSSQQRFQVASDFTITVDNSTISLSGGSNEGIGGPPGATLPAGPAGPTLNVVNGSSLEAFFIVNGTTLNVDSTSSATLGGGGNPVNGSVIDLEPGATLTFTSETIDQFNTEHLSKLTIGGAVAEEGVNFTIESDGNSGSIVKAITAAPAVIVWTGANGTDIFDEENWDLSNSNVTVIDPNVSIDADVVLLNAVVDIPQLDAQQRFQVASGFTITVDNSTISLSGGSNEGIGGPPGATLPAGPAGPTLNVVNGSSLETFFIFQGITLNVDSTSSATLGGGGNPVNISVIDLEPGATLTFTSETIDQFNTEHLSKLTIGGAVAEEGVNFTIESDGNSGSIIKTITAAEAPSLSIVNNGDGTVTVTFEGKLQAAQSVNDPWQDATELLPDWDGTSPLTIPASEAQLYGRAVK